MKGLTNSHSIQSNNSDTIYAVNDSNTKINTGAKVFINRRLTSTVASQNFPRSDNQYTWYYANGNTLNYCTNSNQNITRTVFNEETLDWSEQNIGKLSSNNYNYIQFTRDGYIILRRYIFIVNSTKPTEIIHGSLNISMSNIYLGNNLCLASTNTENILELKEVNPQTGIYGKTFYTFPNNGYIYNAWYDGELFITQENNSSATYRFYDLSDKASPVLLNKQTINGAITTIAVTGTNIGDYIIGIANTAGFTPYYDIGTLVIYQISSDYTLTEPTALPNDIYSIIGQTAIPIYDVRSKILTIGTADNVYAWRFDESTKQFSPISLNIDLSYITNKYSGFPYHLVLTPDLNTLEIGYRVTSGSSVYPYNILYRNIPASDWTIVTLNNVKEETITGIASGETNEEDKYEIKTLLPNKLTLTVNVTQEPDTFEIRGDI